jgi:hypothetical protein
MLISCLFLLLFNIEALAQSSTDNQFVLLKEGQTYEFNNSDSSNSKELKNNVDIGSEFDYVTYDSKGNVKSEGLNAVFCYSNIMVPPRGKAILTVKKLSGAASQKFLFDKSVSEQLVEGTAIFNFKLKEGDSYEFNNSDLDNWHKLLDSCDLQSMFDYVTYDSKGNIKQTELNKNLCVSNIDVPAGGKAVVTAKKILKGDAVEFAADKSIIAQKVNYAALFNVKLLEGDSYEFDNSDLENPKQLMNDNDSYCMFDYVTYNSNGGVERIALNAKIYYDKIVVPAGGKAIVTAKKIEGRDSIEFASDMGMSGQPVKDTALFNVKLMKGDSYEFDNSDSDIPLTVVTNPDFDSNFSFVSYNEDGSIADEQDMYYRTSVLVPQKGKLIVRVNKVAYYRDNIEFGTARKIQIDNVEAEVVEPTYTIDDGTAGV